MYEMSAMIRLSWTAFFEACASGTGTLPFGLRGRLACLVSCCASSTMAGPWIRSVIAFLRPRVRSLTAPQSRRGDRHGELPAFARSAPTTAGDKSLRAAIGRGQQLDLDTEFGLVPVGFRASFLVVSQLTGLGPENVEGTAAAQTFGVVLADHVAVRAPHTRSVWPQLFSMCWPIPLTTVTSLPFYFVTQVTIR